MNIRGIHGASPRWSGTLSVLAVFVMVLGLLVAPGTAGADPHSGQSVDVVIIGGPIVYRGGTLPTTGSVGELGDFNFTSIAASSVTAAALTGYDTAVLNVGSGGSLGMACNVNNLSTTARADLVAFVAAGHKLIITDSECTPQDYSWLPYPFTTANPGARGARGTLNILEENLLSTSTPATDPHYIDAAYLGSSTDAVGDMNVMTTYNANWCVDMSGTNYLQVTGPVHTYAKTGVDVGLIIYNGLDLDALRATAGGTGNDLLRKIWVQELQQPFNPSNLPCGVTVVGITLGPASAQNMVGESHTVTATLKDLLGAAQSGILVTFNVTSGPNAGDTGTDTTDTNGEASFTYTGDGGIGTDQIEACFTPTGGAEVCSQTVSKEWLNTPPVADPNGPYAGDEGSAISLDGTGSSDPDGDSLTYSWSVNSGLCTFDDASSATPELTCTDNGDFTVTLVVDDGQATDSNTASVTVSNVPPTVTIDGYPIVPVMAGDPVTVDFSFTDPGSNDTHTATCAWDDGTITMQNLGTVTSPAFCTRNLPAGNYTVTVTVTDDDGGVGQAVTGIIVVYEPVPFDVKPTSCRNPFNVDKKGVMPVAILGTAGFDVTMVDPATVSLEGVSPLRWSYEDVATPYEPYLGKQKPFDCTEEGPDGYLDLTFKFEASEIAAALGTVTDGDVLLLHLAGNLFDGTYIIGEDVIVILKK